MIFLGTQFLGDEEAYLYPPTASIDLNYVKLKKGRYDDLYLSNDTSSILNTFDGTCPSNFDHETILHAKFDSNANAGNVNWTLSTVSHIIIKVRKKDTYKWRTLKVVPITTIDDFIFYASDNTIGSGNVEISVIPILNGIESHYYTTDVECKLNGIFISEKDIVYRSEFGDYFLDTERVTEGQLVPTPGNKFPTFMSNSDANYNTGTFIGSFFQYDEITKEYKTHEDTDVERTTFNSKIQDFLSDKKPKLLRHPDGRTALIQAIPTIQDKANGHYANRVITFQFAEIGDCTSEEDLYNCNITDITSEWWNK